MQLYENLDPKRVLGKIYRNPFWLQFLLSALPILYGPFVAWRTPQDPIDWKFILFAEIFLLAFFVIFAIFIEFVVKEKPECVLADEVLVFFDAEVRYAKDGSEIWETISFTDGVIPYEEIRYFQFRCVRFDRNRRRSPRELEQIGKKLLGKENRGLISSCLIIGGEDFQVAIAARRDLRRKIERKIKERREKHHATVHLS